MTRIFRYLLLSLVCSFLLCAKADTDYSSLINTVNHTLVNINADTGEIIDGCDAIVLLLDEILSEASNISTYHTGSLNTRLTQLVDYLSQLKTKIDNIDINVSSLEYYANYIMTDTASISSYLTELLTSSLDSMQDSLSSLDTFGDSLDDIIDALNNVSASAADIAMHQGELNKEETQQDILDALEDIKGRITVFPEEDIHRLVSIGEEVLELLTESVRILQKWEGIFDSWNRFYYQQFIGMADFSFDYYRLLGSPYFDTGYDPQLHTFYYSTGTFVDTLYALLRGHLNLLESINDGVLYLAKSFSTNGQAQVENDFQQQKDDVVSSLDQDYQQLREYTYRGITYNLRDTKLYDVSSFISSFESQSYEAVKVHAVDISGFSVFGDLPTYFEFKYDLTPISSYLELVRNVFTIFWVLFFASFWIFLVSLFYRFYNFLYRLLCMVPGQSAPPPGPGLPSGGAVMA